MAWARRVVGETLHREGQKKSVSVLLTGDRESRRLNRRYLKHDYATDVIAFDYGEAGDLVVSCQIARRIAKEIGISFKEELARYLTHGTLHLLGYNDKKKKDYQEMHARQEKILSVIANKRRVTPKGRPLPARSPQNDGRGRAGSRIRRGKRTDPSC